MKIWVTGIGILSPLAVGARATMDALCEGRRAFSEVTLFDVSGQRSRIAAEVKGLDVRAVAPSGQAQRWSRADAMAAVAVREALLEARLEPSRTSTDLVIGGTTGATFETEDALPDLLPEPSDAAELPAGIEHPLALTAEHLASALGPFGRVRTVSSACSTGANALLLAANWLRAGLSERVVAGAVDGLCRVTFTGFNALGSLDVAPCRPFDHTRAGLCLGEGAAFLVLEREAAARARGAEPICEFVGWAAGAEAHHITNPEPQGTTATRLMRRAMQVAGLTPDTVDYLNAHGTATRLNDIMEVLAAREAFGSAFDRIAVSSTKGQLGHTLGAAGAIEAAVAALAVAQGRVPPTVGLTAPDSECLANHVLGVARELTVRAALSNSFGFGGLDAVVAFARTGFTSGAPAAVRRVAVLGGASLVRDQVLTSTNADALLAANAECAQGPLDVDLMQHLDATRARRLGRAERLVTTAAGAALGDAMLVATEDAPFVGLIAAKASGNPDATGRFLERVRCKGSRFAPPADFPNLMLSALAGHAAIYHRLRGPTLATTARGAGGAAAACTAFELILGGEPAPIAAAAVEEWGMAARLAARNPDAPNRSEGASCVVLGVVGDEASKNVRAILTHALPCQPVRLAHHLGSFPPPSAAARVITCGGVPMDWLAGSPWQHATCVSLDAVVGARDDAALLGLLTAVAAIGARATDEVLLVVRGMQEVTLLRLTQP